MISLILNFLFTYWREILALICVLITVVIHLVKKKPCINLLDSIKEDCLELLPDLICKVETDGNGQLKKNSVIDFITKYVKRKYQIEVDSVFLIWLSDSIEMILSTPKKKGV